MKIYVEPINLNDWDLFTEVTGIGYVESFYATKSMEIGDMILLYVTGQKKPVEKGVYAYGMIISEPYMEDREEEQDARSLYVKVSIARVNYQRPLMDASLCKDIFTQVRSVHQVSEEYYGIILERLNR